MLGSNYYPLFSNGTLTFRVGLPGGMMPTPTGQSKSPKTRILRGHTEPVWTMTQLKNRGFASGSSDGTINLWNQKGLQRTLEGHTHAVVALVELKNGMLASVSNGINVWTQDGERIGTFEGSSISEPTLIQLGNGQFVTGSIDNTLTLWEGWPIASRATPSAKPNKPLPQIPSSQTTIETELKRMREMLEQVLAPKASPSTLTAPQIKALMQSPHLQETIFKEISQRQEQLSHEMAETRKALAGIQDRRSTHYQKYEAQLRERQEQMDLQNPPSVCTCYTTIEKHLSTKLVGAMTLISELVVREGTKNEKRANMGGKVVEALCGAIPLVGGVAGSLVSLGIEMGVEATAKRSEGEKHHNIFDSVLRFEDAMTLAELAARRTVQSHRGYIQTLIPGQATQVGENAAEAMYTYLAEGHLKNYARRPMEEKISALVQAANMCF